MATRDDRRRTGTTWVLLVADTERLRGGQGPRGIRQALGDAHRSSAREVGDALMRQPAERAHRRRWEVLTETLDDAE
jgi:hypothetical protein